MHRTGLRLAPHCWAHGNRPPLYAARTPHHHTPRTTVPAPSPAPSSVCPTTEPCLARRRPNSMLKYGPPVSDPQAPEQSRARQHRARNCCIPQGCVQGCGYAIALQAAHPRPSTPEPPPTEDHCGMQPPTVCPSDTKPAQTQHWRRPHRPRAHVAFLLRLGVDPRGVPPPG